MKVIILYEVILCVTFAVAGPSTKSYKDQYCTDPRTMEKHSVYEEWADAYSCTRHRCQPGGRNLAIYTVGCKLVEAPESAIECEEVVEDTNMQFPFCCTRLRCLVVVRGEVWTKVLGQPWETLPAAPWSHMYKMKRPPPADSLPKGAVQGPVYEIQSDAEDKKEKFRSWKKTTQNPDVHDPAPRVAPAPDIVIALATSKENIRDIDSSRHKKQRKTTADPSYVDSDNDREHEPLVDDQIITEKVQPSEEKYYETEKAVMKAQKHQGWTEVPHNQWNDQDPGVDATEGPPQTEVIEEKADKQTGLQALVDAIGNRMRDIENVVQRMSDKVHQNPAFSEEIRSVDGDQKRRILTDDEEYPSAKKISPEVDHSKRSLLKNKGSKYLHDPDVTSEMPLFVQDSNMNRYFTDASNSIRRISPPKEPPPQTYMAPVDTRRSHFASEEVEKKRKHSHKKKRGKVNYEN
ncbi:uncharacterized protein LOC126971392 isoform X2 [Leptidea sinapis]|uniref:uncharacterized protein LOC126971392 isoform X2 n=1 Tax=Leptidea sinapis TaxID=189913 RepID=UPI00212E296A|nr:uncharacterized protein LOC126971392 isoform X2 [Leptidea sinapis]